MPNVCNSTPTHPISSWRRACIGFGCAMAHGETVAEAVAVHGEDLDKLLAKLNEGLAD